jgi:FkbM family methyltransferase
MNIIENNFFKRAYQKLTGIYYKLSYSQTGEDLIVEFLAGAKKIKDFTYLDIGANHPVRMNNTYKFYEAGCKGVCIEPDPYIFSLLRKKRPKDVCLNIGIADKEAHKADFYIMETPLLNTFSKEEAESLEKNNHSRIKEKIQVPLKTVESIIDQYFGGKPPVFINLDVEGLDELILKGFPFQKYRPFIFCVETVHYTDDASSGKRTEIMEIMKTNGYAPFADTYLNTIFIDTNNQKQGSLP